MNWIVLYGKFRLSIVILTQLFVSCNFFDNPEFQSDTKYLPLWERNFGVGYTNSIDPIIDNDMVIFSPVRDQRNDLSSPSTLLSLNKNTGEMIWKWENTFNNSSEKFYTNDKNLKKDGMLFISSGPRFYSNILNEGKLKWRSKFEGLGGGDIYESNKNLYSIVTLESDLNSELIISINQNNGEISEFLKVKGSDSIRVGIKGLLFDENSDGDQILTYTNTELHWSDKNYVYPYIVKYNITKDSMIYKKQLVEKGWTNAVDHVSEIVDGKIYIAILNKLICVDYKTGNQVWRKDLNSNMVFSGFLLAEDDYLYAKGEFELHKIDPENGKSLWKREGRIGGTGSRLQYHKGVLYFFGGARFQAVDTATGEQLLDIEAPSTKDDSNAFFSSVLTIDHENDRIYTASYTHAYCYPTLR